jgi:two-component system phosphate regulon sensor histidine kinase PhoR
LEKVDLKELLAGISEDILMICESEHISFQTSLSENMIMTGDKTKLRELFLNLLENAIKYNKPGGEINLSLTRAAETAQIKIQDTGIGIAPEHLPHIFERFYRVNASHSNGKTGSGLGLAICKHIVEMHNGKIEVESKLGGGSTFTVVLPLVLAPIV